MKPIWWLAGLLAVVALAALIVFLLTRGSGSQLARRLPPIATPEALAAYVRGDVRQVSGDRLDLVVGQSPRTITLASGARVEVLQPVKPDVIAPGDVVSVGGAPNLVNTVAVKMVVVIPAGDVADPNAAEPRSKAGFTGWEAYPDPLAPVLTGRVRSVGADGIQVDGPAGTFRLTLDANSAVRRLMSGGPELVHGGDHVAFAASAGDTPRVMLDMPQ